MPKLDAPAHRNGRRGGSATGTADLTAATPTVRAKHVARQIQERQYRDGLRTIQGSDWASDIYTLILNECPHVPEEDVVRLFRNRHPTEAESVLGEALFREYNLTHGGKR